MLRLALQPKWLGLLLVALLIATAFATLGSWQLNRSRQNATPITIADPAPITDVVQPGTALPAAAGTTPLIITGTLRGDQAIVVDGRVNQGEPVRWLVAPVLIGTGSDGAGKQAKLPVVLGAFPATGAVPTGPSEPAQRQVQFTAMIQPSEEPLPAQQPIADAASVSSADLVARWGTPMYAGFVFADRALAEQVGLTPIKEPTITVDTGYAILNLSYALQWWLFAAVAGFLWWRLLRDAYRDHLADQPADQPADQGDDVADKQDQTPRTDPRTDRSLTS